MLIHSKNGLGMRLTLLVLSLQDHHAFWLVPMCTIYRVVKSTSPEACCHQVRLSAPCCVHHIYIYMKDLCWSKLVQIGQKAPPLFCLLVRYSACIVWHNITLHNHIPHIIKHHIEDLAEKPPPQEQGKFFSTGSIHFMQFRATFIQLVENFPPQEQGNFFRLDVSISCNFEQLWFSWQKSPLPRNREIFLDWIYPFDAISSNFGFRWQKSPPPTGKFF